MQCAHIDWSKILLIDSVICFSHIVSKLFFLFIQGYCRCFRKLCGSGFQFGKFSYGFQIA